MKQISKQVKLVNQDSVSLCDRGGIFHLGTLAFQFDVWRVVRIGSEK